MYNIFEEVDKTMGKRKKSSNSIQASNEFATLEVDSELKPVEESAIATPEAEMLSGSGMPADAELDELLGEKSKDDIIENASSSKFLSRLTPEMVEKLEKVDALEKHCLELEEENAKLSDSVNSYLEEIEALKSKRAVETPLGSEMSMIDLKKELDEARHEIIEMRKSLKELHEENDNYLLKISELTFENAKLTSQLQEIEKSLAMSATPTHESSARRAAVQPSTRTMKNQPQFANLYLQNGYQDW